MFVLYEYARSGASVNTESETGESRVAKARFKRRTSHVPSLMLMRKNKRFCSV